MILPLVVVIVVALTILAVGLMKVDLEHVRADQKFLDFFGIRHLNINSKSDVAIAIGIVAAFLAAILLTGPK